MKSIKGLVSLAMVVASLFFLSGCGMLGTPLPKDLSIKPPASDVPVELAALSGGWAGTFTSKNYPGSRSHTLIVEEIVSPENVMIVYGYGPFINNTRGNYSDGAIRVSSDKSTILQREGAYSSA